MADWSARTTLQIEARDLVETLPPDQVSADTLTEMIWAGETTVALEILCENVKERAIILDDMTRTQLLDLCRRAGAQERFIDLIR